jgi:hypothetical protein
LKIAFILTTLFLSSLSFAQGLQNYNDDYTLNFSVSACNSNARVEINGATVKIVNPDQRDNRGWATTTLTLGEKTSVLVSLVTIKIFILSQKKMVAKIFRFLYRLRLEAMFLTTAQLAAMKKIVMSKNSFEHHTSQTYPV